MKPVRKKPHDWLGFGLIDGRSHYEADQQERKGSVPGVRNRTKAKRAQQDRKRKRRHMRRQRRWG